MGKGILMQTSGVNYVAVLVAAATYFVLGALWYSKPLFASAWMKGVGRTEEQLRASYSLWRLVWAFIGSFIAAYGIARILSWLPLVDMFTGVMAGLLAGICFALPAVATSDCMEGRPLKLTAVNVIYNIFGFVIIGVILGAWR
jgi:hypothetical protein